ncbi:MAG: diaminopropionate ammonia-lyase [Treponemataceae bacterium]|nr:MAG: diaminopropionate ammonia-lyase [Treponemataceae bacterium]
MKEPVKWVKNTAPKTDCAAALALMERCEAEKALAFHRGMPGYAETPLVALENLAVHLGVRGIYLKDESYRFGLNAFKVLGGSYAIARYIAEELERGGHIKPGTVPDYAALVSPETKKKLGDITFYTATDGNHGRGVAWAANRLWQRSVVLMPKGSSKTRLENIRREGAEASITELNYDDAVRLANEMASKDPKGVMVQDTAWDGYEKIPGWIMQGYGSMAYEAWKQLDALGVDRPTHIFVQAGVGSLAGAVQGFFANVYPCAVPLTTVVEASAADCLYRSVQAGKLVPVSGDLNTIMAGLACGEGNTISWAILKNYSGFFVSAPDWVAARGMRVLAAPLKGDPQVISGESGAVCLGLVSAAMTQESCANLREALGLNADSVVLVFSTEGDTDPERFREIVWDGWNP